MIDIFVMLFVCFDVVVFFGYFNVVLGLKMYELELVMVWQVYCVMKDVVDLLVGDFVMIIDLLILGLVGVILVWLFDCKIICEFGLVMVFFYGGGFVIGDFDIYVGICVEFVWVLDMLVVLIDYWFVFEYCWFVLFDDCEVVVCWVVGNLVEFG